MQQKEQSMADDATARPAGRGSGQRRIGQSHRPAGPEIPRHDQRRPRRGGTRRADRLNFRRWLSTPALRRRVDRLLGRVLAPRRGRTVRLSLPAIASVANITAMLEAITPAVRRGSNTPTEAASLAKVADAYVRAIETSEFDRRLRALEAAHAPAR
jgi:hypothetical protein